MRWAGPESSFISSLKNLNAHHQHRAPLVRRSSTAEVLSDHPRIPDTWRILIFPSLYSQGHVYATQIRLFCEVCQESCSWWEKEKKSSFRFNWVAFVISQNIFVPSLWCSLSRLSLGPLLKVVKKWKFEPNKTLFCLTLFDGGKKLVNVNIFFFQF